MLIVCYLPLGFVQDAICVMFSAYGSSLLRYQSLPETPSIMVTTGEDHSVLDRSLMILENEHAQTEDKVAACTELEG
jgi:hypothetical protein